MSIYMYVYVYVYMCICIYIYVYIYVYICICIYACICMCMYSQFTPTLLLSNIEYANDAAMPVEDVDTSSRRLTHFARKANEEVGTEISIPKTKAQHIMENPPVSATTEDDIENFNDQSQLQIQMQ